jgi:phospholipid/cholesterol/gamma-HCH transport system ATP-binding protein
MTTTSGVSIEITGLRKSFNGTPVLEGVDLRIEAGEIMVIVGGSGEGKSVLLRHIAGLETPDGGSIRLQDMDLRDYLRLPPGAKPFRLSMVFQGSALLNSLTVAENISLRLKEPQIILYDEPTADLDPLLTQQIGALITRIHTTRGATQIVVAHNLALASEIGTHIAVLHAGRIVDYQRANALARSSQPHTQELLRAANLKF